MAGRLSSTLLSTQQVVDLLDDGEDADFEMDDCFFPGSDDELGFEEEDTVYGNSIIKCDRIWENPLYGIFSENLV